MNLSWQLVTVVAILVVCATILALFSGNVEIFEYVVTAVLSFLAGFGVGAYIVWRALTSDPVQEVLESGEEEGRG